MAQRKPIDVHFAFRQYADQQLESIVIFEAERSLRRVLYVNDAFKELTGYLGLPRLSGQVV
ncbi:PAS domain-containing protein [Pigmentiphaga sp. NML030171]|uniref:PAS domain-containing protein n=1 Tax=Pigmentiphaga sp. NML030171 TaxID=2008676 RepID=UPI000B40C4DB|nr:PAS domain-containing protein [Pigmentiphaga sp. NML030171]